MDNMKHNLLSVIHICDQGYQLLFTSKYCKIRKKGQGKLEATATRTPNNIYILDKIKNENVNWERKRIVGFGT